MSATTCTVCKVTVHPSQAVIRSVSLERVYWCRSCAEAEGFYVPPQRRSLAARMDAAVGAGVAEVERYANGVRR